MKLFRRLGRKAKQTPETLSGPGVSGKTAAGLSLVVTGVLLQACSPEFQNPVAFQEVRNAPSFSASAPQTGSTQTVSTQTGPNQTVFRPRVSADGPGRRARGNPAALLNANELINLYAGSTAYGRHNQRAGEWSEFTAYDGRALYLNRYGEISDGTWWVSGNQICFSYGAQTGSSCNHIQRVGSYYQYIQTDGKREFYATKFLPGDGANLIERAAQIR